MAENQIKAEGRQIYKDELGNRLSDAASIVVQDKQGKEKTAYRTDKGTFKFQGAKNETWLDIGESARIKEVYTARKAQIQEKSRVERGVIRKELDYGPETSMYEQLKQYQWVKETKSGDVYMRGSDGFFHKFNMDTGTHSNARASIGAGEIMKPVTGFAESQLSKRIENIRNGGNGSRKINRLFGRGSDTDETIILGKNGKAEYGINMTLCAKTARENAKNLFGITLPQKSNAREVINSVSKTYPPTALSSERNVGNIAEVAYVSMDVTDGKGKGISHVALATKPRGSTTWFITDPYQSGSGWIKLSDYPARIQGAWKLSPQFDNLTTARIKNKLEVRSYKNGIAGGTEYATNTPEVEYGKTINTNNLFLALGDRNLSGTMGDDMKRRKLLGFIPLPGKKESKNISDEHTIALELQSIADLPKTKVVDFVSKCIKAGGGGDMRFGSRQDVVNAFFGSGYNKALHQQFLLGFELLHLSGYLRDVKSQDTLPQTSISAVENQHPGFARMIDGKLQQIDRRDPLFQYVQSNRGAISRSLSAQLAAFVNANNGTIGASVGAGVDINKYTKVVAGMANGVPGVGIMFQGQNQRSWGKLSGTLGVWNALPFAQGAISRDNTRGVASRLDDYTESVKSIGVSAMVSPIGGGAEAFVGLDKVAAINAKVDNLERILNAGGDLNELPDAERQQFSDLYNTIRDRGDVRDYNKATHAIVQMYKMKLAEKNTGLFLSGAGAGVGLLYGLPAIIAHIRVSYVKNQMVPDAKALATVYDNFMRGEGLNNLNTSARGTGALNEQLPDEIYNRPFTARGGLINGQPAMRFEPKSGKPTLTVLAAPTFRENIRYDRNGVVDVMQMPGRPFPIMTLRSIKVDGGIRHYLIVGSTRVDQRTTTVSPGNNPQSEVRGEMTSTKKTLKYPFYHGVDSIPNVSIPDQRNFYIGATLRQEPKIVRQAQPEGPKPPTPVVPEGPKPPIVVPEGPGNRGIGSTPNSQNGDVPQGPPQNVIPQTGEGGRTGSFIPSPDAPPAGPGAVGIGSPKPTPTNIPYDPFAG